MRRHGPGSPGAALILTMAMLSTERAAADDAQTCAKASGEVAITACSRAIATGGLSGQSLAATFNNRAVGYQNKGDLDRAIADYNQAIQLDPKSVPPYNDRGNAWRDKGDLDRAIADYNQAIQLDPNYAFAYNGRGNVWSDRGNLDKAIADYNQAIQLDPNYAFAYNGRGNAWRAKGDLDRAISDYNDAIRLKPEYVTAYRNRARTWNLKGDAEKSIADFDQAIKLNPKDAETFFGRGRTFLVSGALPNALADLNQASELNPRSAYTALWLDIAGARSRLPTRLSDVATHIDMTKWPAPVIRLFLGQLTSEAVFAAADDANPVTKKGQVCEANFYGGELALLNDARDDAVRLLKLAASDCPKTFIEYDGAIAELKLLGE